MLKDIDEYQRKTCKWALEKDNFTPDPHTHTKPYS